MQRIAISFSVLLLVASAIAHGSDPVKVSSMQLSEASRKEAFNWDGSCVQCSLVHCGKHCNVQPAAKLLWDSEFGPAIRGGSTPGRVAAYCNQRHIKAWNVTGSKTEAWMEFAAKTGRFAAIGAGRAHFQTLWGRDYERNKWLVCNNQTPATINEYDRDTFMRLHLESGPWVVVLQQSSSENPTLVEWWK